MTNTSWIFAFCNSYAPLALSLAKLFIYFGLVMGVIMAAAEAYKLYREALAIKAADPAAAGAIRAANPAVAEVIKGLAGVLTGAKAWLALVILGVVLFWLAGNATPNFCTPEQPRTPQAAPQPQASPGTGAPTRR